MEPATLLCIDIGNTNIKLGLFEGEKLCCRWRIATDREHLADEYAVLLANLLTAEGFDLKKVQGCAISSVVPALTQEFVDLSARYLNQEALVVTSLAQTAIKVNTEYPAEVGSDLVVNALAARELFGAPVIIIGFGTATTFVAVSAQGDLEGVAIAPGIITGADSLFRATSTLPRIALTRPKAAIGRNTIQSLQAGLVYGYAGMVEGLVKRIQAELGGKARVIATGGAAPLIAPETGCIDFVELDLTLIGLRMIYNQNHPRG
jgi:type III pantothenate kinase